ncbi:MAG: PBP1A family penicillin-binding protein [Calditrichia bacterium]
MNSETFSPGFGKEPSRLKELLRKKITWIVLILLVWMVGYTVYLVRGLPPLEKLENIDPALVTRLYSADGKMIHELFKFNRVWVPLERIPMHTRQALLSTEDRRFYEHWGIDIHRIPAVLLTNITHMGFRAGFSTITMQLSRNLYFGFQKTLSRKFREILTAIQIERTYSKDEILEMYFNVTYFGHGIYGIQGAAKKYFNKEVSDLTIEESALLIPLLKSPAYYSPIRHPDRALKRRNIVLHNMLVVGHITQAEYDSLKQLPVKVQEFQKVSKIAPYFTEYVRQQLNVIGDSLDVNVYEDGLNVYTTLDTRVQACMDSSVRKHLPELQARVYQKLQAWKEKNEIPDSVFEKKAIVQNSFVALDHRTGAILAMIGGRDFEESKFNRAVQAPRQPGSAFKPFLYATALDNGYTPVDKFLDQPVVIINPDGSRWDPENYDQTVSGLMTLREALQRSRNLVSVRLIQEVGPANVRDFAKRMGLTTIIRPYPTLALGSSEVILLELAAAYGTFANKGVWVQPHAIERIEDRFGNVIYETHPTHRQVLNEATAYLMTNMLETVINQGTGGSARWKYGFRAPAAGKTGTTNDYTDAWFVGFTPVLTAGVWVGLDDPKYTLGHGETGSRAALPFWADFMKMVYDSLQIEPEPFQQPPDVVRLQVCEESGKLATNFCPKVVEEVFNVKYHPTEMCPIHGGPGRKNKKSRVLF